MAKLYYQGHGSVRVVSENGTVAYIDPYAGDGYDLPADLVLVSHQHHDHNALQLVPQQPTCTVLQNFDLLQGGLYKTRTVGPFTVEAFPAENKNHPRSECIGFVLTVDGITLYITGDTSRVAEMDALAARKVDYALFCCDGIYNMDLQEASACAQAVAARVSIPMHMKPGGLFDEEMAARFTGPGKRIVRPGEEIQL